MTDNIELLKQISHTLNLHGSVQQNTQLHERIESAIESAATPPDVEQKYFNIYINGKPVQSDRFISGRQVKLEAIARIEDGVWLKRADGDKEIGNDELVDLLDPANLNAQFFTGSKMTIEGSGAMKAGQSAVQDATKKPDPEKYTVRGPHDQLDFDGASYEDALRGSQDTTPQEWEQIYKQHHGGLSDWKFNYWSRNIPFGKAATAYVAALRSELSAAQEENKRLRDALGVVMPYLDDFEKDNIQDSSVGLFKDYRFTKAYHELQSFYPPESGEQTK